MHELMRGSLLKAGAGTLFWLMMLAPLHAERPDPTQEQAWKQPETASMSDVPSPGFAFSQSYFFAARDTRPEPLCDRLTLGLLRDDRLSRHVFDTVLAPAGVHAVYRDSLAQLATALEHHSFDALFVMISSGFSLVRKSAAFGMETDFVPESYPGLVVRSPRIYSLNRVASPACIDSAVDRARRAGLLAPIDATGEEGHFSVFAIRTHELSERNFEDEYFQHMLRIDELHPTVVNPLHPLVLD